METKQITQEALVKEMSALKVDNNDLRVKYSVLKEQINSLRSWIVQIEKRYALPDLPKR
jgi:hypothetical protein